MPRLRLIQTLEVEAWQDPPAIPDLLPLAGPDGFRLLPEECRSKLLAFEVSFPGPLTYDKARIVSPKAVHVMVVGPTDPAPASPSPEELRALLATRPLGTTPFPDPNPFAGDTPQSFVVGVNTERLFLDLTPRMPGCRAYLVCEYP